jgi:hypothetical protein
VYQHHDWATEKDAALDAWAAHVARRPCGRPWQCLAICYRVIAYSTSSLGSKRTAPGRAALGRATLGLACFEVDFAA